MKTIVRAWVLLACLLPIAVAAQSDKRSLENVLRSKPMGDDGRMVNANLPQLVNMRVSQLEEDLNLTQAQMPLWNAYRARVQSMLDDERRGARFSASETTAPKRLDSIADSARNRLTAVEDIVDAGKALYEALTPQQRAVADRRLALPLATLTGNDAGGDARVGAPNTPPK